MGNLINRALLSLLFILHTCALLSQINNAPVNKQTATGATYAVVVGISKYASAGMPQLQYADRDAQFFADYLKSKAGGSVPEENIRLLVNENATFGAVYDALDWLLATCNKDDLVYFYFSGHGDMENTTIYNLGFLLTYNTPRTNYINNAIRIEDLNNFANTLSVKLNAKCVLITDACHSGKLAGSDNRGVYLVGNQLRTVQTKEIRITSCAPDQLSAEDEGWGGGRGVFSYYLVNGLQGLADDDHDKIITVSEIKNYLDSSLAADALLAQKAMKQNPVINGNNGFKLAQVDNAELASLQKQSTQKIVSQNAGALMLTALAPLPVQPQTYFFTLLQKQNPEELFDFAALNKLPKEAIPFECLQMLADSMKKSLSAWNADTLQININLQKINLLQQTLHNNNDALNRFNDKLAVTLSDRGQEIINLYIEGDAAELERRNYYNSKSNGYDAYPQMFSVALKLTNPSNYLYQIIQVKLHYFTGVALRLKIPTVINEKPLLDSALAEQKKAFALEENAAYIQNELGVLSLMKNDLAAAEKYYLRATQIAPQWVIPWSNLGGLYTQTKNFGKATAAISKAMALKPDFQGSYISNGFLNETQGNLLFAEESYRKSIDLNSRHYLPFERLGYVYMNTTQYEMADSFFYEADKRKKGFHFHDSRLPFVLPASAVAAAPMEPCFFDTADIGKNDVIGRLVWALREYTYNNEPNAEKKFKDVIALDSANPLAFHYLGRLLYFQQRWEEAAIIFNLSIKYYLNDSLFERYCDSVAKRMPVTKSKDCLVTDFRESAYLQVEDHYFAGRMYEKWNHFAEAEYHYNKIIRLDYHGFVGGYYLLWNMLENMGRYKDAENVLRNFESVNAADGQAELNAFYKRMIKRIPESGDWYYKAGLFLYHLAAATPDDFKFDKKKTAPDTHLETYIISAGNETVPSVVLHSHEMSISLIDINESFTYAEDITYPRTDGIADFKKADSLLQADDDAIADINYKMGDLYVWQGVPQDAIACYKKSIDLKPGNANTRMKLATIYNESYRFQNALEQLDSLYQRKEINFDKQVLLAKYYIHESRFAEAMPLLNNAQQIHPYKIAAIADLKGRLQLLSKQLKKALAFYKDYLVINPGDASAYYTIARINAQIGNSSEALNWLEMAIQKGFNFGWVLQLDTAWNSYGKQNRWIDLQKKIRAKVYTERQ